MMSFQELQAACTAKVAGPQQETATTNSVLPSTSSTPSPSPSTSSVTQEEHHIKLCKIYTFIDNTYRDLRRFSSGLRKSAIRQQLMLTINKYKNGCAEVYTTALESYDICYKLSQNIMRTIDIFKEFSTCLSDLEEYNYRLCEIMSIFIVCELRLSVDAAQQEQLLIAHRIIYIMRKHLVQDEEQETFYNILRTLVFIPKFFNARDIICAIFSEFIPIKPMLEVNVFPDKIYIMYIIVFYRWMMMQKDEDDKLLIVNFAENFMKPSVTLCSNNLYGAYLPMYISHSTATRTILNNLKYYQDIRNASIIDNSLKKVGTVVDLCDDDEDDITLVDTSSITDFAQTFASARSEPLRDIALNIKLEERTIVSTVDLTEEEESAKSTTSISERQDKWLNEFHRLAKQYRESQLLVEKHKKNHLIPNGEKEAIICLDSDSEKGEENVAAVSEDTPSSSAARQQTNSEDLFVDNYPITNTPLNCDSNLESMDTEDENDVTKISPRFLPGTLRTYQAKKSNLSETEDKNNSDAAEQNRMQDVHKAYRRDSIHISSSPPEGPQNEEDDDTDVQDENDDLLDEDEEADAFLPTVTKRSEKEQYLKEIRPMGPYPTYNNVHDNVGHSQDLPRYPQQQGEDNQFSFLDSPQTKASKKQKKKVQFNTNPLGPTPTSATQKTPIKPVLQQPKYKAADAPEYIHLHGFERFSCAPSIAGSTSTLASNSTSSSVKQQEPTNEKCNNNNQPTCNVKGYNQNKNLSVFKQKRLNKNLKSKSLKNVNIDLKKLSSDDDISLTNFNSNNNSIEQPHTTNLSLTKNFCNEHNNQSTYLQTESCQLKTNPTCSNTTNNDDHDTIFKKPLPVTKKISKSTKALKIQRVEPLRTHPYNLKPKKRAEVKTTIEKQESDSDIASNGGLSALDELSKICQLLTEEINCLMCKVVPLRTHPYNLKIKKEDEENIIIENQTINSDFVSSGDHTAMDELSKVCQLITNEVNSFTSETMEQDLKDFMEWDLNEEIQITRALLQEPQIGIQNDVFIRNGESGDEAEMNEDKEMEEHQDIQKPVIINTEELKKELQDETDNLATLCENYSPTQEVEMDSNIFEKVETIEKSALAAENLQTSLSNDMEENSCNLNDEKETYSSKIEKDINEVWEENEKANNCLVANENEDSSEEKINQINEISDTILNAKDDKTNSDHTDKLESYFQVSIEEDTQSSISEQMEELKLNDDDSEMIEYEEIEEHQPIQKAVILNTDESNKELQDKTGNLATLSENYPSTQEVEMDSNILESIETIEKSVLAANNLQTSLSNDIEENSCNLNDEKETYSNKVEKDINEAWEENEKGNSCLVTDENEDSSRVKTDQNAKDDNILTVHTDKLESYFQVSIEEDTQSSTSEQMDELKLNDDEAELIEYEDIEEYQDIQKSVIINTEGLNKDLQDETDNFEASLSQEMETHSNILEKVETSEKSSLAVDNSHSPLPNDIEENSCSLTEAVENKEIVRNFSAEILTDLPSEPSPSQIDAEESNDRSNHMEENSCNSTEITENKEIVRNFSAEILTSSPNQPSSSEIDAGESNDRSNDMEESICNLTEAPEHKEIVRNFSAEILTRSPNQPSPSQVDAGESNDRSHDMEESICNLTEVPEHKEIVRNFSAEILTRSPNQPSPSQVDAGESNDRSNDMEESICNLTEAPEHKEIVRNFSAEILTSSPNQPLPSQMDAGESNDRSNDMEESICNLTEAPEHKEIVRNFSAEILTRSPNQPSPSQVDAGESKDRSNDMEESICNLTEAPEHKEIVRNFSAEILTSSPNQPSPSQVDAGESNDRSHDMEESICNLTEIPEHKEIVRNFSAEILTSSPNQPLPSQMDAGESNDRSNDMEESICNLTEAPEHKEIVRNFSAEILTRSPNQPSPSQIDAGESNDRSHDMKESSCNLTDIVENKEIVRNFSAEILTSSPNQPSPSQIDAGESNDRSHDMKESSCNLTDIVENKEIVRNFSAEILTRSPNQPSPSQMDAGESNDRSNGMEESICNLSEAPEHKEIVRNFSAEILTSSPNQLSPSQMDAGESNDRSNDMEESICNLTEAPEHKEIVRNFSAEILTRLPNQPSPSQMDAGESNDRSNDMEESICNLTEAPEHKEIVRNFSAEILTRLPNQPSPFQMDAGESNDRSNDMEESICNLIEAPEHKEIVRNFSAEILTRLPNQPTPFQMDAGESNDRSNDMEESICNLTEAPEHKEIVRNFSAEILTSSPNQPSPSQMDARESNDRSNDMEESICNLTEAPEHKEIVRNFSAEILTSSPNQPSPSQMDAEESNDRSNDMEENSCNSTEIPENKEIVTNFSAEILTSSPNQPSPSQMDAGESNDRSNDMEESICHLTKAPEHKEIVRNFSAEILISSPNQPSPSQMDAGESNDRSNDMEENSCNSTEIPENKEIVRNFSAEILTSSPNQPSPSQMDAGESNDRSNDMEENSCNSTEIPENKEIVRNFSAEILISSPNQPSPSQMDAGESNDRSNDMEENSCNSTEIPENKEVVRNFSAEILTSSPNQPSPSQMDAGESNDRSNDMEESICNLTEAPEHKEIVRNFSAEILTRLPNRPSPSQIDSGEANDRSNDMEESICNLTEAPEHKEIVRNFSAEILTRLPHRLSPTQIDSGEANDRSNDMKESSCNLTVAPEHKEIVRNFSAEILTRLPNRLSPTQINVGENNDLPNSMEENSCNLIQTPKNKQIVTNFSAEFLASLPNEPSPSQIDAGESKCESKNDIDFEFENNCSTPMMCDLDVVSETTSDVAPLMPLSRFSTTECDADRLLEDFNNKSEDIVEDALNKKCLNAEALISSSRSNSSIISNREIKTPQVFESGNASSFKNEEELQEENIINEEVDLTRKVIKKANSGFLKDDYFKFQQTPEIFKESQSGVIFSQRNSNNEEIFQTKDTSLDCHKDNDEGLKISDNLGESTESGKIKEAKYLTIEAKEIVSEKNIDRLEEQLKSSEGVLSSAHEIPQESVETSQNDESLCIIEENAASICTKIEQSSNNEMESPQPIEKSVNENQHMTVEFGNCKQELQDKIKTKDSEKGKVPASFSLPKIPIISISIHTAPNNKTFFKISNSVNGNKNKDEVKMLSKSPQLEHENENKSEGVNVSSSSMEVNEIVNEEKMIQHPTIEECNVDVEAVIERVEEVVEEEGDNFEIEKFYHDSNSAYSLPLKKRPTQAEPNGDTEDSQPFVSACYEQSEEIAAEVVIESTYDDKSFSNDITSLILEQGMKQNDDDTGHEEQEINRDIIQEATHTDETLNLSTDFDDNIPSTSSACFKKSPDPTMPFTRRVHLPIRPVGQTPIQIVAPQLKDNNSLPLSQDNRAIDPQPPVASRLPAHNIEPLPESYPATPMLSVANVEKLMDLNRFIEDLLTSDDVVTIVDNANACGYYAEGQTYEMERIAILEHYNIANAKGNTSVTKPLYWKKNAGDTISIFNDNDNEWIPLPPSTAKQLQKLSFVLSILQQQYQLSDVRQRINIALTFLIGNTSKFKNTANPNLFQQAMPLFSRNNLDLNSSQSLPSTSYTSVATNNEPTNTHFIADPNIEAVQDFHTPNCSDNQQHPEIVVQHDSTASSNKNWNNLVEYTAFPAEQVTEPTNLANSPQRFSTGSVEDELQQQHLLHQQQQQTPTQDSSIDDIYNDQLYINPPWSTSPQNEIIVNTNGVILHELPQDQQNILISITEEASTANGYNEISSHNYNTTRPQQMQFRNFDNGESLSPTSSYNQQPFAKRPCIRNNSPAFPANHITCNNPTSMFSNQEMNLQNSYRMQQQQLSNPPLNSSHESNFQQLNMSPQNSPIDMYSSNSHSAIPLTQQQQQHQHMCPTFASPYNTPQIPADAQQQIQTKTNESNVKEILQPYITYLIKDHEKTSKHLLQVYEEVSNSNPAKGPINRNLSVALPQHHQQFNTLLPPLIPNPNQNHLPGVQQVMPSCSANILPSLTRNPHQNVLPSRDTGALQVVQSFIDQSQTGFNVAHQPGMYIEQQEPQQHHPTTSSLMNPGFGNEYVNFIGSRDQVAREPQFRHFTVLNQQEQQQQQQQINEPQQRLYNLKRKSEERNYKLADDLKRKIVGFSVMNRNVQTKMFKQQPNEMSSVTPKRRNRSKNLLNKPAISNSVNNINTSYLPPNNESPNECKSQLPKRKQIKK